MNRFKRQRAHWISIAGLLLSPVIVVGYLQFSGWFQDPKVALRELKDRRIDPVAESVFAAAEAGDSELLKLLSRAQVDADTKNDAGDAPLHVAVSARHWSAVSVLLDSVVELDSANGRGQVPLQLAIQQGGYEAAEDLLEKGASPDVTFDGVPALLSLLLAGDRQGFRLLLQNGADPNVKNERGELPLYLAIKGGMSDLLLALLDAGAEPNGTTPGGQPLVSYLIEHPDHSGFNEQQVLDLVKLLTARGADLEQADAEGWRPIHYALASEMDSVVAELLPLVNNVDGTLWMAYGRGDSAVLTTLLEKGANPHEVNAGGDSALIGMIRQNQPDMVRLLMDHGADPLQLAPEGQAAIPMSIAMGHDEVTLTLIQHPRAPSPDTYLVTPASREYRRLFKSALLDFYIRGSLTQITPLMAATCLDQKEVVLALLANGANRYASTAPTKVYPIQLAAKRENVQMQQILIGVPWEDDKQVRKFVVNLATQRVTFYINGKPVRSSGISSGRSTHPTIPGSYVITDKTKLHRSNIYNSAKMPYFQRFSCTAMGFHEGILPGYPASHGCLRLPAATAEYFFKQSKLGDRVEILKN